MLNIYTMGASLTQEKKDIIMSLFSNKNGVRVAPKETPLEDICPQEENVLWWWTTPSIAVIEAMTRITNASQVFYHDSCGRLVCHES